MLGLRDLFADLALLTYGGLDRKSAGMNTAQVKTVDSSILIFLVLIQSQILHLSTYK